MAAMAKQVEADGHPVGERETIAPWTAVERGEAGD